VGGAGIEPATPSMSRNFRDYRGLAQDFVSRRMKCK
jgi:hypothetical protein